LTASALVLFCILFVLGFGLRGAVFSTVGGIAVGALMSVCFVAFLFPSVFAKGPRPEWVGGKLLAYSAPLVLSGLAASMLAFVDRFFVASFCSSADMGVYQAASQLSILFSIAYGAFDNIFAPMVADLHARGEKARLAELYRICAKWGFYASAPVFLVILFAPGDLVKFVYGNAYVEAATPLVILSFGKVVMMTTAASGPVLLMTGRQKLFVAIPLAVLPIDLLLNFLLVPAYGLAGAASAAAISALILNAATILAVRKELGIWPFDARYVKAAIATSAAFGLLYILPPFEIRVPALRLFVIAGISLAAFAGCLVALGLDTEDREVLGIVRARVRWPLVPSRSSCRL
jgi:O-antigen/teichoic acid export membrane protein